MVTLERTTIGSPPTNGIEVLPLLFFDFHPLANRLSCLVTNHTEPIITKSLTCLINSEILGEAKNVIPRGYAKRGNDLKPGITIGGRSFS